VAAISFALLSSPGEPPPVSSSAPATGFDPAPWSPSPAAETPGPDAPVPTTPSLEPSKPRASPSPPRGEKAESATPKKPRIGYLSADASPWASVFIDGKEIDQTPISRYPLPVGTHQLVFRNPQLGKELRRTIRIEENRVKQAHAEFGP
jgi:serine/threonine-protein kinase